MLCLVVFLLLLSLHSLLCTSQPLSVSPVVQDITSSNSIVNTSLCTAATVSVPNGGFDTGFFAPWTPQAVAPYTFLSIVSPGYNSTYCLQVTELNTQKAHVPVLKQRVPICPATLYRLSFSYQIPYSAPGCSISVFARDGGNVAGFSANITPTPWTLASFNFSAHITTDLTLIIELPCEGTVRNATAFIDSVALTAVASLEPTGCPKKVQLLNGGFDSGALAPWAVEAFATTDNLAVSLVEGGYNASAYALQVALQPSNYSNVQIDHPVGSLCLAYNYTFAMAYQFVNYTRETFPVDECLLAVVVEGCFGNSPIYRPETGGWRHVRWTCEARKSGETYLAVTARCGTGSAELLPVVTLLLDAFEMRLGG
ncbi:hypothetical protein MMC17_004770 [Xylographa soralifera]|nr:hypothetical protein [Xylographa soralifera]